jgi:hypothetical protein
MSYAVSLGIPVVALDFLVPSVTLELTLHGF